MSKLANAPLVETIFELKWGEQKPGVFEYSQEEQQLLPGQVSVAAIKEGYSLVKPLLPNGSAFIPHIPSHRFLIAEQAWPCMQLGLGIFTINQINEGYDWLKFKKTIQQGLQILNEANPAKFNDIVKTASVTLNYQDAFYPTEAETIENYLENHFNVTIKLPDLFLKSDCIAEAIDAINVNFTLHTVKPKGIARIMIANAMIEGKPGLMLITSIESKLATIFDGKDFISSIVTWSEEAHKIQKHAFKTLINPSAYKDEQ